MKETRKMINILNQNKVNKQRMLKEIRRQQQEKRQARTDILAVFGYGILFCIFVEVICLLVK